MQERLRKYKASIFQALSHPTRIAILEVLRDRELSAGPFRRSWGRAGEPVAAPGDSEKPSDCGQPQGRQPGLLFHPNPVLVEVLDLMRRYFQTNLADAIQMLEEVGSEASDR